MNKLLNEFLAEAGEGLATLDGALAERARTSNASHVPTSIFRLFQTLREPGGLVNQDVGVIAAAFELDATDADFRSLSDDYAVVGSGTVKS